MKEDPKTTNARFGFDGKPREVALQSFLDGMPAYTPPKKRGPKPGHGGRPKGPAKVKLTCMVLPETRAKLGTAPGRVLDGWARKIKTKPEKP